MAGEIYVAMEGDLRFVIHSGNQPSWATASAPVSGTFGLLRSFTFTSAQTTIIVKERGIPNHMKRTEKMEINGSFQFLWTGYEMASATQNSTMELYNIEFKARNSAQGTNAGTGRFFQFHGVAIDSQQFTENTDGDTIDIPFKALSMVGPTASGYLSFP